MADANVETKTAVVPSDDVTTQKGEQQQSKATPTLEEALALIEQLTAENQSNAGLLKKVRKFEQENKSRADAEAKNAADALAAQGKFEELYKEAQTKNDELNQKYRSNIIGGALSAALTEAGVKAQSTALKLIDKSAIEIVDDVVDAKSLKAAISALRESDPFLFEATVEQVVQKETVAAPTVKRATELNTKSALADIRDKARLGQLTKAEIAQHKSRMNNWQ